ncbi:MAG: hypothetical protein C0391_05405 [Anaerolinea sp.]|nr:hypothetical protein [Anaerolinea sp.]
MTWIDEQELTPHRFNCGYCGYKVSSDKGFEHEQNSDYVYICPDCDRPTFISENPALQVPGVIPGREILYLPIDLEKTYVEARKSASIGAYTASVLISRKMLMNISVNKGDAPGKSFVDYIQFLSDKNYVPPGGDKWVDHIRRKGNEATHEIAIMDQKDAEDLITFLELLLIFIYEFPGKLIATP